MRVISQGTCKLHFETHTLCFDVTHTAPALRGQWTFLIAFTSFTSTCFKVIFFILHHILEKQFHRTRTHSKSLVLMPRRT